MTATMQELSCPKCSGPMWDETKSKFYKAGKPIAKCKDKACSGVLWAPKNTGAAQAAPVAAAPAERPVWLDEQEEAEANGAPNVGRWFAHYDKCFLHAVGLATRVEKTGVVVTLEGVSAIAATLFIATKSAI
jgi:hypothetical protein